MRVVTVWMVAVALAAGAGSAEGQTGFGWRLGVGGGIGDIRSTGPSQEVPAGQPATWLVGLDRALGSRFSVGLEWLGTWYDDARWGRGERQALTVTGSYYPVGGLFVTVGAGPGLASWVDVVGPPSGAPGDVLIDVYEGEPAMALTAGVGLDVPAGPFQLTPLSRWVVHRVRGESLGMVYAGIRLSLRSGR